MDTAALTQIQSRCKPILPGLLSPKSATPTAPLPTQSLISDHRRGFANEGTRAVYTIHCIHFWWPSQDKHHMLPDTESRIWQLYAKALAAKTPEDTNRAVQELRAELDGQPFVERRLIEERINNLVCATKAA